MNRFLLLLAAAVFLLIVQTTLIPALLPNHCKPELLLLFLVYLSLTEPYLRGAVLACLTGMFLDTAGGMHSGLHTLVYLLIFIAGRAAVQTLNTESPILVLFYVACATLLQGLLLSLFGMLTDHVGLGTLIAGRILFQIAVNLLTALFILYLAGRIRRISRGRLSIPGLPGLNEVRRGA